MMAGPLGLPKLRETEERPAEAPTERQGVSEPYAEYTIGPEGEVAPVVERRGVSTPYSEYTIAPGGRILPGAPEQAAESAAVQEAFARRAGSPGRPARDLLKSFEREQKEAPYLPEELDVFAETRRKQLDLLERADIAESEAGPAISGAQRAATERADMIRRDIQARDASRQQRLEQMDNEISSMSAELANTEIEKPGLWAGRSFGESLLMGLGVLVMGLGAAGLKDPSKALGAIARKTQENVDKQRAEMEEKRKGIEKKETLYARAFERFQDDRLADQAAKTASLQIIDQELERLAAAAKSPATALRAQQAREALRSKMMEEMANFRRMGAEIQSSKFEHEEAVAPSGGGRPSLQQRYKYFKGLGYGDEDARMLAATGRSAGGDGGGGFSQATREELQKSEAARSLIDPVSGERVFAATEKEAERMRNKLPSMNQFIAKGKAVQRLLESTGAASAPWNERKARAKQIIATMVTDIKSSEELGALDKGLLEFADALLGSPTDRSASLTSQRARFDQAIKTAQDKMNRTRAQNLYADPNLRKRVGPGAEARGKIRPRGKGER